jgi:glyoxylase-like metal-dependent hydrolase (beta-lactamase superfamily II)
MTQPSLEATARPGYIHFKRILPDEEWFEVYEIAPNLFALHEPRHYEGTIVNLVIGEERAALIDTGCGIGNLRQVVEAITDKPVVVVNTHTHLDHLGGNPQFEEIVMFDHPRARRVAEEGVPHEVYQRELLAEGLVTGPWPRGFEPEGHSLHPFPVSRWLQEGDRIDLGGRELEAILTPGEAPDHLCLLDRTERILFCGDILLEGPVWTHLEGGSVEELVGSYLDLMGYYEAFDHLMPGHNVPWLGKDLLPETLAGAERVLAGEAEFREVVDPWGRRLRDYSVGRCSIQTLA